MTAYMLSPACPSAKMTSPAAKLLTSGSLRRMSKTGIGEKAYHAAEHAFRREGCSRLSIPTAFDEPHAQTATRPDDLRGGCLGAAGIRRHARHRDDDRHI